MVKGMRKRKSRVAKLSLFRVLGALEDKDRLAHPSPDFWPVHVV